jgi:RNA polymerase sigma-70 factor (ECF subfamily)
MRGDRRCRGAPDAASPGDRLNDGAGTVPAAAGDAAAAVARDSYGRLVAYLAARSHDIAAAEDALGDAFAAALVHWPVDGVPDAPEAWLLTTARRRLHDRWRHGRVEAGAEATLAIVFGELATAPEPQFPDERLKLMFVCAHPAVDPAARAALMLQTVLGLDAARIASAFLVAPATLSQRLVRAKTKIRSAGIAFEVPGADEWAARLADVLEAIYAAYGTGWEDVAGTDPAKSGLAEEALALAAMLVHLLPDAAEAWGLVALLAFCQSRARARRNVGGDYVPLAAQDTALWDRELLGVAEAALRRGAALAAPGAFQLEAAIQSAHTQRRLGAAVPESAIVGLYDALVAVQPTIGAIVSRACAVGAAHGAAAGLAALATLAAGDVESYQPYWAALAHLAAANGDATTARAARARAVGLSTDPAVRRFLLGAA